MNLDQILDPAVLVALGVILGKLGQFVLKSVEARYQVARGIREDAAKIVVQNQENREQTAAREQSALEKVTEILERHSKHLEDAYDRQWKRLEISDAEVVRLRFQVSALTIQVQELNNQLAALRGVTPKAIPIPEPPAMDASKPKTAVEAREAEVGPKPDVSALVNGAKP